MKLDKQVKLVKQGFPPPPPLLIQKKKVVNGTIPWFTDGVDRLCSRKGCSRLSSPFRVWYKERPPGRRVSLTGEKEKMKKVLFEMKRQAGGSSQSSVSVPALMLLVLVNHQPKKADSRSMQEEQAELRSPSTAGGHPDQQGCSTWFFHWAMAMWCTQVRKEPLKTQTWRLVKGNRQLGKDGFLWFYKLDHILSLMCWIRTSQATLESQWPST